MMGIFKLPLKTLVLLMGVLVLAALVGTAAPAQATATIFFGPSPYLSAADIPAGFYTSGSPAFLEDFENGSLDGGITASTSSVLLAPVVRAPAPTTDSVDADDGTIDGSGTGGHSLRFDTDVTFTFAAPVTAAGMVWTDGVGNFTFEAFGAGMVSLGTINFSRPTAPFTGETDEDVFVGAIDSAGIIAIKLSGVSGIEVDHIQYGSAPPASDSCSGFEPPMDAGAVTVKKNRVLPLKAQLLDDNGGPLSDLDVISPPVIQVLFTSGTMAATDVTDQALAAGRGTDGNQFEFGGDKWQFNLKTKNSTAAGTYTITMLSGDTTEYSIDPTCTATFVINNN